mmetsp:Transcript_50332/g.75223  ORF Transcript_50332/g.75223 Transcript_50332/m.75223 type:complete len:102 (+) Transcript_50332:1819-2124(+)
MTGFLPTTVADDDFFATRFAISERSVPTESWVKPSETSAVSPSSSDIAAVVAVDTSDFSSSLFADAIEARSSIESLAKPSDIVSSFQGLSNNLSRYTDHAR